MILLRFFSVLLLIIFLLNSFITHAHAKNPIYFHFGQESDKWFFMRLEVQPDSLQNLLEIKYFESEKSAQNYVSKKYGSLDKISLIDQLDSSQLASTENRNRQIWKTENQWSWGWEQKYAEWIHQNVNTEFFYNNNIATDCADVAIAARWIFARIHKLPAAQTLAGSNVLFSNESFRNVWSHLPTSEDWTQDQLFRAALDYVLDNTYTHTLWKDSYSIHISQPTFVYGTHHLNLFGSSGHTMLYTKNETENFRMIYSDVPRTVRKLYSTTFAEDKPDPKKTGFFKIRWPIFENNKWVLQSRDLMPHYSLNQYSNEFVENDYDSYTYGFLKAIGLSPSIESYLTDIIDNLWYAYNARVAIVNEGYEFCLQNGCAPGTPNYEGHSTPTRDGRIMNRILNIEKMLQDYQEEYPYLLIYWNHALDWEVSINDIHQLKMSELIQTWKQLKYSSDPRDSVERRWGLQ